MTLGRVRFRRSTEDSFTDRQRGHFDYSDLLSTLAVLLVVVGGLALAQPAGASAARATSLVSAPGAGASGSSDGASFVGDSSDGTHVFFRTLESLVGADTDGQADIYERSGETTTLVSAPGPGASGAPQGAHMVGSSSDGARVFFSTSESLVGGDDDGTDDVYERSGGTTTLLSPPAAGATAYVGASSDGTRVFIQTTEGLVPADGDGLRDIYEYQRQDGTVELVSGPGDGASGTFQDVSVPLQGAVSSDGGHVFWVTAENLVGADTDGLNDIYEHSGGTTKLVSAPGAAASGGGPANALFEGISSDGTHVYFKTFENMVSADTDGQFDIYERFGGATTLVSAPTPAGSFGSPQHASFAGASNDGSHVFFTSSENLAPGEDGSGQDLYERFGGTTTMVSPHKPEESPSSVGDVFFAGSSSDGTRVFFTTVRRIVAADTDFSSDIYERSGGTTTLVSAPGAGSTGESAHAAFAGSSSDGTRVFFSTIERLVGADDGGGADIYERFGGTTTLVSVQGAGANGSAQPAGFGRASSNGRRVLFTTAENMVGADADGLGDVYESFDNTSPNLGQIGDTAVNEDDQLQFTISATDPDGDALTYTASNLPAGATFDPGTRTFMWTPRFDQAGDFSGVHFEVTDGTDVDSEEITINVGNSNRAPVLDVIGDKTVAEGDPLQFTISATDPDGDALTYSGSNLPAGATFDPGSRTFAWTPGFDQAGDYPNVHFEVSDGPDADSANTTVMVTDAADGAGGGNDAGPGEFERTLRLSYSEKKDKFKGKLRSEAPTCITDQKVKVFEKRKGKDPKLGSATTSDAGKYSLKEKKAKGKFYARTKHTSTSIRTCLAARSKTIKVG